MINYKKKITRFIKLPKKSPKSLILKNKLITTYINNLSNIIHQYHKNKINNKEKLFN